MSVHSTGSTRGAHLPLNITLMNEVIEELITAIQSITIRPQHSSYFRNAIVGLQKIAEETSLSTMGGAFSWFSQETIQDGFVETVMSLYMEKIYSVQQVHEIVTDFLMCFDDMITVGDLHSLVTAFGDGCNYEDVSLSELRTIVIMVAPSTLLGKEVSALAVQTFACIDAAAWTEGGNHDALVSIMRSVVSMTSDYVGIFNEAESFLDTDHTSKVFDGHTARMLEQGHLDPASAVIAYNYLYSAYRSEMEDTFPVDVWHLLTDAQRLCLIRVICHLSKTVSLSVINADEFTTLTSPGSGTDYGSLPGSILASLLCGEEDAEAAEYCAANFSASGFLGAAPYDTVVSFPWKEGNDGV
jgi:hypothetical protein